ncbi:PIN domain-containing protein, partial [Pontibacillus litoralis]
SHLHKNIDSPHSSDFSGKVIDKYFDNQKPFDINKPSFQDAIIWETVLDFYNEEFVEDVDKLFLLTNNIKDFGKVIQEGKEYELHDNLYEEAPELIMYRNAEEFFKNEKDELHDYLIDTFELDETETIKIIEGYVTNTSEIEYQIENLLNNTEFEGEYFSGWGEDSQSILRDTTIEEVTKDVDDGYIEINCSLEYNVDFSIAAKNPVWERDDGYDEQYLSEDSDREVLVSVFIKMLNDEIITFSVEDVQYI